MTKPPLTAGNDRLIGQPVRSFFSGLGRHPYVDFVWAFGVNMPVDRADGARLVMDCFS